MREISPMNIKLARCLNGTLETLAYEPRVCASVCPGAVHACCGRMSEWFRIRACIAAASAPTSIWMDAVWALAHKWNYLFMMCAAVASCSMCARTPRHASNVIALLIFQFYNSFDMVSEMTSHRIICQQLPL